MRHPLPIYPMPAVACILALVCCPSLARQPAADEAQLEPIERLVKDLNGIGAHYKNVKMKVGSRMAGASLVDPSTGGPPPTPAEACCKANLKIVERKLQHMARTIELLYVHYNERRDREAIGALETIRAEMQAVARGFAAFKMERTEAGGQQALLGVLRPYNRLRLAIEQLQNCCPVEMRYWAEPAPAPGRP